MHWGPSCSQSRGQEPRGRHRLSTVIQPLRQSAGEVVDLTVDEDGERDATTGLHTTTHTHTHPMNGPGYDATQTNILHHDTHTHTHAL